MDFGSFESSSTWVRDGQRYELVGSYYSQGGTEVLIWRAACAKCGEPFECKSPAESFAGPMNRRCRKHRAPGRKVRKLHAKAAVNPEVRA